MKIPGQTAFGGDQDIIMGDIMIRKLFVLAAILVCPAAFAETRTLTWDHDGVNVDGWYIYIKENNGVYSSGINYQLPAERQYVHTNTTTTSVWCYQVAAWKGITGAILVSPRSAEACKDDAGVLPPDLTPNAPTNLQVN